VTNQPISQPYHLGNPPADRPVLVFDGDCGFCRFWIERWRGATGGKVDYEPYQKVAARYPEIPLQAFQTAVQFIEPDGHVTSGSDAVFRALEFSQKENTLLNILRAVPFFDEAAHIVYRIVANNRTFFSLLTRLFFGCSVARPTYLISRWIFMRLLGVVYLIAFLSLLMQIPGLAGSHGISPAGEFLQAVKEQTGIDRYWLFPTICWINSSDHFLVAICIAGMVLSCAVMAGFLPGICLFLLWALYLSLITVCGVFLGFQWDALLLQTGFLAIFLVPPVVWPDWKRETGPSKIARWLLLFLLFCLMFESGIVKLSSRDDSWSGLTALTYHYQTQPLPLWTSWYLNQSPLWFETLSVMIMFVIELGAPFCIFGPRNLRRAGCAALIALQLFIAATGNYCFFNLLAIALCLLLLDDDVWPAWCRKKMSPVSAATRGIRWPIGLMGAITALDLLLSGMQLIGSFRVQMPWPAPLGEIYNTVSRFCTFNNYGLFAVMTRTRPEIIIEGSNDGENWLPYEFRWKPGDVNRRPGLVAPFQPRLDWQMWFAALGDYQENPWIIAFMARLLEGSPDVLKLMAANPFPDAPPRYIRASLYDYKFTRSDDHSKAWWKRTYLRPYCPAFPLSAVKHAGDNLH